MPSSMNCPEPVRDRLDPRATADSFTAAPEDSRRTARRRDLLVMRDESQRDYAHAVPKTSRPVGPRMNLTFRHFLG